MEPLQIGVDSRHRVPLTDLALELALKSAGFRRSLPESFRAPLADLVRSMNCYYKSEYSKDAKTFISALFEKDVLTSKSTRAPLGLAFPASVASRWIPGLFPERIS